MRRRPTIIVDRHARNAIRRGALSVYAPAVRRVRGTFSPGDVVDVRTGSGELLGVAFAQASSADVRRGRAPGIVARIFAPNLAPDEEPEDVVMERIRECHEYRIRLGIPKVRNHYRVVFSEADRLPGLIVDKYDDIAVFQTTCPAMERIVLENAEELLDVLDVDTLYEKNDSRKRKQLGLPERKRVVAGEEKTRAIVEEGPASFHVDVESGQKTGFYIDQVDNRLRLHDLGDIVEGARVLDVFTYTGTFAVHAALAGAEEVIGVDKFDRVVEAAYANADLNDVRDVTKFVVADAFAYMEKLAERGEEFDVVILDPPAFITSKEAKERGKRAYYDVNRKALRLVANGGLLITCSCSHFLNAEELMGLVSDAAAREGKGLKMLGPPGGQPACHPIDPGNPDTRYLDVLFVTVHEAVTRA